MAPDLLAYPRFLADVRRFMRAPLTLEDAEALVAHRLARRAERFLVAVSRFVYGIPGSPYRALLTEAGCEYGDLARMVRADGVEATLERLRDAGVYLTYEEFKGLREIRRGARTIVVDEAAFDNPHRRGTELPVQTGATRSRGSPVRVSLEFTAEVIAPSLVLSLAAMDARGPMVLWMAGFPSGAGVSHWLALGKARRPSPHWFSMTDPHGPLVARRHRWMWRAAIAAARTLDVRLPPPVFAPVHDARTVLDALWRLRDAHGAVTLMTSPSAAVRLASAARQRGGSLDAVSVLCAMEPLTPAKAAEIRRAGAAVFATYGMTEAGIVAGACGRPQAPDDMHLLLDCYAMVLRRRDVAGVGPADAYLLTSLVESPRKILLNTEVDDFGAFLLRDCGCAYGALGFRRHLAEVRSFTKLTVEGTMVLGTELVRIIEEELPRTFGGRSIDYQLVEAEQEDRLTRLLLLVRPEVGPLDEARVAAWFVERLRRAQPRGVRLWLQDRTIRVVRRDPVLTPRGKLLPFHTQALAGLRKSRGDERRDEDPTGQI